MIKKITLIVSCLFLQMLFSQKSEPIYYDKDWEITTKANASYYRLMPLKQIGELVLLQDFYMNGTPQFEGYALKSDDDAYVGDIVWYDVNGNDENFSQYRNDTKTLTLLYYHANGKVRKKVQYKNGVKDGETIIYGSDGTVLTKGIYAKGKPESGSFENVRHGDNYDYNTKIEEVPMVQGVDQVTADEVRMAPPPPPPVPLEIAVDEPKMVEMTVPTDVFENAKLSKNKKNKKTVTEKIFWANSKQLAQETVYEMGSYDLKPISRKDYDKTGKLLQSLNETHFDLYGSRIANGIDYEYYLQNNFANEIKTITKYEDKSKSGIVFSYFPTGKIAMETFYKNGWKDGDEKVYDENGRLKSKRVYKEAEPFNGNFDERVGGMSVNQNYTNGIKEGEVIAKNEDGKVVANGIYKNGKPFNGTFIEDNENRSDNYELINVENFKKIGLQKVFGYRLENLIKTYTVKDDKLNGMTTFYDDGKVVGTLEYKNDEPYDGTLIGSEKTSVFKNGKVIEETFFEDRYSKKDEDIVKRKLYENGTLVKVKDFSFTITENPQSFYEGIFKNGKPYSGYFESEDSSEVKQINYYENGILKFQYSNDYLKNMDNYRHQSYDIKSTFKDGKIFDGVEYVLNKKQFISRYWKNGILQAFDWDLFGMHYFNRIHFVLKNNEIEISDMQNGENAKIKIDISKGFNKKLIRDNEIVVDSEVDDSKLERYNEQIILYYIEKGKITSKKVNPRKDLTPSEGGELFQRVYFSIKAFPTAQEVFNKLSEDIVSNKLNKESDEIKIIGGAEIDAAGKPQDGIIITQDQNNTYTLQFYMKGELKRTIEKVMIDNVEEQISKLEK